MERIVFLLQDGARISCMLNPESVLIHRRAGLIQRSIGGESIAAGALTDDPLFYAGGGTTEVVLELLFDLAVAGSTINAEDVRDLTGPLWRLSETASGSSEPRLPVVRMIWGKTWNIPGVVAEVAERLEQFAESGAPRRSFLTMRFLRANVRDDSHVPAASMSSGELKEIETLRLDGGRLGSKELPMVDFGDGVMSGRADVIASRVYGTESLWRLVLAPNGELDPLTDLTNRPLTLLPRSVLGGRDA